MEKGKPSFQKYLFVCENQKEGACCGAEGAQLRESLKQAAKDKGISKTLRVSRSGCLDVCADGPNVLLLHDGVWFKKVSLADIPEIIQCATGS